MARARLNPVHPGEVLMEEFLQPLQLSQKSDWAGAVTLRVSGMTAVALTQKLSQLPTVKKAIILKEEATSVTARAFPKSGGVNAAAGPMLAQSIADAAQGWRIEELHTEEGRLDEVFRSITMPDTAKEETK